MTTQTVLTKAERRLFRAFWQDGLLDIIAGATVALIGVGWLLGVFVPALGLPIVGVFAWQGARRRITEPRLGSVEFSDARVHDIRHGLIAIVSLGLVVGGNLITRVWLAGTPTPFTQWFAPAIPATIIAAMSLSCAAALGLWRFVAYGVVFGVAGLAVAEFDSEPWWALITGGAVVALCGVDMLVRFLRRFPELPNEAEW